MMQLTGSEISPPLVVMIWESFTDATWCFGVNCVYLCIYVLKVHVHDAVEIYSEFKMFQGRLDFLFPPLTDYGNEYIWQGKITKIK